MARRKPSWLRRDWWFNVRRHPEETQAWSPQLAVERLLQEGLLQFLQGGEFAFVEVGEVLGLVAQVVGDSDEFLLNLHWRETNRKILNKPHVETSHDCALGNLG